MQWELRVLIIAQTAVRYQIILTSKQVILIMSYVTYIDVTALSNVKRQRSSEGSF
jgi:hypothetical protein